MEKSSFKHIYYRCAAQLWHLIYSAELFQENSLNLSKMIQKGADMKSTQLSSLPSSPRSNLSPSTLWGKQNHKFPHTQCPWQTYPSSLEFFCLNIHTSPVMPVWFFSLPRREMLHIKFLFWKPISMALCNSALSSVGCYLN